MKVMTTKGITLEQYRKMHPPLEADDQAKVCGWLAAHGINYQGSASGEKREKKKGKNGQWYCPDGVKLKRMGHKKGFPDIIITTRPPALSAFNRGVGIEMKRIGETMSSVTPAQRAWHQRLIDDGWAVRVCFGYDDAIKFLKELGYGA